MSARDESKAAKQKLKLYVEWGVLGINLLVLCAGIYAFFISGPRYLEFRDQSPRTGVQLLTDKEYRAARNRLLFPGALGIFLAIPGLVGAIAFGLKFFDARKPLKSAGERAFTLIGLVGGGTGVLLIFLALSWMD